VLDPPRAGEPGGAGTALRRDDGARRGRRLRLRGRRGGGRDGVGRRGLRRSLGDRRLRGRSVGAVRLAADVPGSTWDKLVRATQEALVEDGIAHLSARSVAARAGVNQALVFYHFGTVSELVEAAARSMSEESIGHYRERFAGVDSLT